jgi:hypothetical protein
MKERKNNNWNFGVIITRPWHILFTALMLNKRVLNHFCKKYIPKIKKRILECIRAHVMFVRQFVEICGMKSDGSKDVCGLKLRKFWKKMFIFRGQMKQIEL